MICVACWSVIATAPKPDNYKPILGYSDLWTHPDDVQIIHWNCDASPPAWCDRLGNVLWPEPKLWAPLPYPQVE